MTEAEWLDCNASPIQLLNAIQETASPRKLRLGAIAFCRSIFVPAVFRASMDEAITVAERLAEGQSVEAEQLRIFEEIIPWDDPLNAAIHVCNPDAFLAARHTAQYTMDAVLNAWKRVYPQVKPREWEAKVTAKSLSTRQCALIRDVFGLIHLQMVHVTSHWLAWNDRCIERIAQAIYDKRAFDRLPILADALEDAGCDNADILNHCRSGGEHVRGCRVVDLLLGKS